MDASQLVPVRILSHNIRYATQSPFRGEKPWSTRCHRLCAELVFHSMNPPAAFICLQEALYSQLEDVHRSLNDIEPTDSPWEYIGVGRDDGRQAGEFGPIFYRPSVWQLEDWKTLWLSETPERPSRGWDAACNRIVTVGFFKHHATRQKIVVMNTHLDHQGRTARAMSASTVLKLVDEYQGPSSGNPTPVFLAGDFNSPPNDEAYKIMTAPGSKMADTSTCISKERRYGHQMTFTSFGEESQSLIDFIFNNKTDSCQYKAFGVLENKFDDGVYISDHRAVVVDFMLSNP